MATRRSRRNGLPRPNVRTIQTRDGRTVTEKIEPADPTWPGGRPGRPSKLTAEVEKRFMDCIRAGNYQNVCARYVGLSPDTVEGWVRRGRGALPNRPPAREHIRFVRLLDEAKATTEVLVVGNIVARSAKDTRAAELWLRADPERARRWPRDGGDLDDPGSIPQLAAGPVTYDQRRQYVIVGPEEADGIINGLLATGREERAARLAARVVQEDEQPIDGTRIARLDGLRSDEGDIDEDD